MRTVWYTLVGWLLGAFFASILLVGLALFAEARNDDASVCEREQAVCARQLRECQSNEDHSHFPEDDEEHWG